MSSALGLYLKYFHDRKGADLAVTLEQFDSEHQLQEQGIPNSSHVDRLHPDEKENGGVERVISIGFTRSSYKQACKKKTRGRLFEQFVKIRQDRYSKTGNAWKVWDSGLILARWVYNNSQLFEGKVVHEVGSGCGLAGIVAAWFCNEITLSDYKDEILENLDQNVAVNFGELATSDTASGSQLESIRRKIKLRNLDWQTLAADPTLLTETDRVDIVMGSDLVYGLHLAQWLPVVVDRLLKPDGLFFSVMPKNRWGIEEFVRNLEALGFNCTVNSTPDALSEDFVKKSCWDLFVCHRTGAALPPHVMMLADLSRPKPAANDDGVQDLTDHFTEQEDWDVFRDLYKKKKHQTPS